MSLTRRLELIEWSRRHNAVLIEDDYDSEYRYQRASAAVAAGIGNRRRGDLHRHILESNVSVFADWIRDRAAELWCRGCGAPSGWPTGRPRFPSKRRLADFIAEGHLERHIRRMRRIYGERRDALVESLERHFGDRVQIRGDAAGMHVLVRFQDDERIAEKAAAAQGSTGQLSSLLPHRTAARRIHSRVLFDWRAIHPRRNPAAGGSAFDPLTAPLVAARSNSRAIR